MSQFGSFLSFNTGLKVATGIAVGYFGTVAVSHWRTSDSVDNLPPPIREERDDKQKKFEFEVQQRSEQLNKKEQTLKALEETLAKRESELKEQRAALQYMQAKNNASSEGETVTVQGVQEEVSKVVEPAIVKVIRPDPVVPPTDYVPRRPQVFDGGGNREPVVTKASAADEPRLLYFRDPSFATDGVHLDAAIPRRDDVPRHLADITKRRRFANLKPQHVVSFRATRDGWSLETPDGMSGGSAADSTPETRTEPTIAPTVSGEPRRSGKGDAATVTLHGHGSKPPSDGRSAVSAAERNAFNEEKRLFAEQKEAFEQEKKTGEKELANKTEELEARKAFLNLREENKEDAADLFDLAERQTVQRATNFNILRQEKAPYEIAKQDESGMTIKAKTKEPNEVQANLELKITGKKQPFEELEKESGELFVSGKQKGSLGIEGRENWTIERRAKPENQVSYETEIEMPPQPKPPYQIETQNKKGLTIERQAKPKFVHESRDSVEIDAVKKEPYQKTTITSMGLSGKERAEAQFENTNSINLFSLEKPENEMDFGDDFTVPAAYGSEDEKPKEPLLVQQGIRFDVRSEPKETSHLVSKTRAIALPDAQLPYAKKRPAGPKTQKQRSRDKETLQPEQTGKVMLSASEKTTNEVEYGDWLEILPKAKPKFKQTPHEGFTVDATKREPYETESTDAIEFAYEEPKKTENTINSDKGFLIPARAKPTLADKPNLRTGQSHFDPLTGKKNNRLTRTAEKVTVNTPQKFDDESNRKRAKKNVRTNKKEKRFLDVIMKGVRRVTDDTGYDILDSDSEDGELEEEKEKGRENIEKISAFTLDEEVPAAKFEIKRTEDFNVRSKGKEKTTLIPMKTQTVEVKAKREPSPKFEISKTQSITAEAQTIETKESATEPKPLALTVSKTEASLQYTPKTQAKPLSVQNKDGIALTGEKSFVGLETALENSTFVSAKPKAKPVYIKTDNDSFEFKGNNANFYLQTELEATKKKLDTEVQTAEKVPLSMENIKGEEPSEDWIIDLDEDDLDEGFESEKGKLLQKRQHEAMADTVRIWVRSYISDKDNTESVVSKILEGKDKETKEVKEKLKKIEEKLLCGNDKLLIQEVRKIIAQYISGLNDTSIDAVETPKVAEANKMFKPGWSILAIQSKTVDDTIGKKFFPNLSSSEGQKVCFIGKSAVTADKSAVTMDTEVQAGEPRISGYLEPECVMKQSFVDDKLSYVSRPERKDQKHKKLKSDYLELLKDAQDMLNINDKCRLENEELKSIKEDLNEELVKLKKDYENLKKAFKELRDLEETGCCNVSSEYEIKKALKGAKEIAVKAMEGITDGTLRGEKAEKLLERFGKQSSLFCTGVGNEHGHYKCKNAVCQQRIKFMDSLAYLLRKMARIPEADAFKPIQADRWTLEGGASKVSKPFEIIPADSFGLGVNPEVKSKKEAQKKQLSKLMAENEDLKSQLKEESDKNNALFDIMNNAKREDTEELEKKNKDLKQKAAELEKKNKEKDEKIEELKKYDKQSTEPFQTAYSDNDKLRKELEEKNKEITEYRMLLGEKQKELEKVREEKDKEIDAQKRENRGLEEDKFLLEMENKTLKDRPGNKDDKQKNDEKKEGDGKKPEKQPKNPKIIKEIDDFRKRLEEAEEEIKNITKELKNAKNLKSVKQLIMKLLDSAERRLKTAAEEFKNDESFVKRLEKSYGDDSKEKMKMTQKQVAGKFVNTVSLLNERITEGWKKMVDLLKPDELPEKVLNKSMEDKIQKRIDAEVKMKIGREKEEYKAKIKELELKLEQERKKQKLLTLDKDITMKTHMRKMKTMGDLSIYNPTEKSSVRNEKKHENGGKLMRVETLFLSNKSLVNFLHDASYSRDYSKQHSGFNAQTPRKKYKDSGSDFKYRESLERDNPWATSYAKLREKFTEPYGNSNFLASIAETKDEIHGDEHTTGLPEIRKAGTRLLKLIASWRASTQEATYGLNVSDVIDSWENETKKVLLLIGDNGQTSVEQPPTAKEYPATPKMGKFKPENSLFRKTEKRSTDTKKNLRNAFDNAESSIKTKGSGVFIKKIVRYEDPNRAGE